MKYTQGALLPRRVVAQLGYAIYALAMDSLDPKLSETDRVRFLRLQHELSAVLRDHGDDISGNSKSGRASGYWTMCRALDEFGLGDTEGFRANVLFRLRWMLSDCGFRLRVRTTFGTEHVMNNAKAAA